MMDANDMKVINDIYIKILKKGRSNYNNASMNISSAQNLESYATYLGQMNGKLEELLDLTDKFAHECLTKATEIRTNVDINNKYKDNPERMFHAHKEIYSEMSWADITENEDETQRVLNSIENKVTQKNKISEYAHTPIMYKNISNLYNHDLCTKFKIPIITSLNEMPSSLYWYNGDQTNPEGIYICLSRGFYVQVPFPNVVDGTKDFSRTRSIKCKYNTEDECCKIRKDLASKYNSDIRECNFAHKGDQYIKIGTSFRCPNMPRFGNHIWLNNDLNDLPDYDVKMLLMYSLSDILLTSMWFQKQKNNGMVLTNIDIC